MSEANSTDNSLNERISKVNVNNDTSEDISDSILNNELKDISSHKPRNKRKQKKHCKRCDIIQISNGFYWTTLWYMDTLIQRKMIQL